MPSGKTHLKIEWMFLVLWAGIAALLVRQREATVVQASLFVAAYVFSMLLLSPDLDLSDSRAHERWGVLRWLWLPYAWAFRHRQLSHHLLWGPLSRVAYIGGLTLAATWVYLEITKSPAPRIRLSAAVLVPICLGVYLPNVEHILADRIVTSHKRRRGRRRL
jgi:uncharacterized metal-binding protein